MEETLISLETAKLAKEKGFNEFCNSWYEENANNNAYSTDDYNKYSNTILTFDNQYSAPTQSLLQKWLREEHNIHINIYANGLKQYATVVNQILSTGPGAMDYEYNQIDAKGTKYKTGRHDTYEKALEKGLEVALKLINYEN